MSISLMVLTATGIMSLFLKPESRRTGTLEDPAGGPLAEHPVLEVGEVPDLDGCVPSVEHGA